jgi:hypothetical protein
LTRAKPLKAEGRRQRAEGRGQRAEGFDKNLFITSQLEK